MIISRAMGCSMKSYPICDSLLYLAIDVAQLLSVTEIALPQTFLCVDRSSIQYDFHGGANACGVVQRCQPLET